MSFEQHNDGSYTLNVIHDHGALPVDVSGNADGLKVGSSIIPWTVIDELQARTYIDIDLISNINLMALWPSTTYDLGSFKAPATMEVAISISENGERPIWQPYKVVNIGAEFIIRIDTPFTWGTKLVVALHDKTGQMLFKVDLATKPNPHYNTTNG